jgi:hypothetical protein
MTLMFSSNSFSQPSYSQPSFSTGFTHLAKDESTSFIENNASAPESATNSAGLSHSHNNADFSQIKIFVQACD